jgi:signal transduction histidine kinase
MNEHLEILPQTFQAPAPHSFFVNWNHGRLLRHTFLIVIILINGGLMTSSAIELFLRYRESVMGIRVLQQGMADAAAFKIQQYVEMITHTLRITSQTSDLMVAGITEDYRFELSKLMRVFPALTQITVVDATGRERIKESRVEMVDGYDLSDRSNDEAFTQARAGESFFSQVYFVRQSEPYMRIAVPMEIFAGQVIGVLIAEVNLKYIWDVISGIHAGQTGYAYVVSSRGELIAHPDISLALQKQNLNHLSQVKEALNGRPLKAKNQNLQDEQVFATYASIPTLGWLVFVERLKGEAYDSLYASLRRLGLLLLLGLGISWLASWLIGRRVLHPLEKLRLGAEKLGAGELHYRIDLHTGDEFEELADTFNHMARQLETSYTNLEEQVEARTQELARSVGELEIASQHKSRFLAHMSHELRTPLNTIMGFIDLTLKHKYGEIPEMARERLKRVEESSAHLLRLIDDVLDISKIEAGRFELNVVQYSMLSLVETVVIALENEAAAKKLQLAVTTPPDLPIGWGDEGRLTQVLLNLVSNAIKYTEMGEIGIEVATSEDNFRVTVRDTGAGIAPADQHRIFESFEQAHASESRVQSGTGLGLAICKTIVEMHGGSIGVASDLGRGSLFWCMFPIRVDQKKA